MEESEGSGNAVAVGPDGNITLAGGLNFGGSVLTATFSADGVQRESKRWFVSTGANANGLAVDDSRHTFLIGSFLAPINFGLGALTSAGGYDIFLAEFAR